MLILERSARESSTPIAMKNVQAKIAWKTLPSVSSSRGLISKKNIRIRYFGLPAVAFRPPFRLSGHFLGIVSLVFSKYWHGARNPYEIVCYSRIFWKRFLLPQKLGKWTKKWTKNRFFKIYWKKYHQFSLNLCYNENLYYLQCSCANPIIGKILFSEIWAKMFSANQITGFFNQSYLQIKSMK